MIGNLIKFYHYEWIGSDYKRHEDKGIVVDAYTKVSGSSKYESLFGFGEGKGETKSIRIYKVQCQIGTHIYFKDIEHTSLIEVLEFNCKEIKDEKILK